MTIDQLAYWCFLMFLLWILVDGLKQLSKVLIKRDKMPKAAKDLLSNFEPTINYKNVSEYTEFLMIGATDGWMKCNQRTFDAINWMRTHQKECEKFIEEEAK